MSRCVSGLGLRARISGFKGVEMQQQRQGIGKTSRQTHLPTITTCSADADTTALNFDVFFVHLLAGRLAMVVVIKVLVYEIRSSYCSSTAVTNSTT